MKSVQPNKSPRERREALLAEKRASSCTVDSLVRHWKSWRFLNFGDTFRIGTSAQLWKCNAVHRQPDEVSTPAHCGDYDIIKVPNDQAETSERSGDSSPAPCSAADCDHEYESDGGPCIHCGKQGGLLTPNRC